MRVLTTSVCLGILFVLVSVSRIEESADVSLTPRKNSVAERQHQPAGPLQFASTVQASDQDQDVPVRDANRNDSWVRTVPVIEPLSSSTVPLPDRPSPDALIELRTQAVLTSKTRPQSAMGRGPAEHTTVVSVSRDEARRIPVELSA